MSKRMLQSLLPHLPSSILGLSAALSVNAKVYPLWPRNGADNLLHDSTTF